VILVIGGRSKIGSAVIDGLLDRGQAVRALARSGEVASAPPDGAEVVVGDLADGDSLHRAMAGVDRAFLLCGPTPEEVRFNRNAIDAAKAAGVHRLVRSSILGSDATSAATFVRDHGACDAYLRDSGLPHVIIRPNLFLQNVLENTVPSIGEDGVFYQNAGAARISMVDTRDAAAVAVAALTGFGDDGDALDVTGPVALSYDDVAAALSSSLARPITYVDAPDEAMRRALGGFGLGEWMVGALVDLYQDYRRSGTNGYAAAVSDIVSRATGRPPRTLDDLLDERK
jgi:uncharacterized protein YbjT (DUF2867 family)